MLISFIKQQDIAAYLHFNRYNLKIKQSFVLFESNDLLHIF